MIAYEALPRAVSSLLLRQPLADYAQTMAECGAIYLRSVLAAAGGNRCKAATIAGCHRNTITRLCEGAGIPKDYGRKKSRKTVAKEKAAALDRALGRQP
jgi:hypothetical protein